MLYLKYGTYQHAEDEASVVMRYENKYTEDGQIVEVVGSWDISGILQADTQAALTTAIQALEAAYAFPDKDIGVFISGGTPTAHRMRFADWDSIRPMALVYPVGDQAEYVAQRTYQISIEARRVPTNAQGGDPILEWSETIEIQGTGGADWAFQPVVSGNWPSFNLTDQTPVTIVQSGSAVGLKNYVGYPDPIFPSSAEHGKLRRRVRTGPRKRVPELREFGCNWSYTFEFMGGVPNVPNPFVP